MVFTEIKSRNKKKYYYRVFSFRKGKKVLKKRIYLGADLDVNDLTLKEKIADTTLNPKNKKEDKSIEELKRTIATILKKHYVKRAGIFGSYARGENNNKSDIDILIDPPKNIGFGYAKILFDLENKLGKRVDLITYLSLNPKIKQGVLNEEIRII